MNHLRWEIRSRMPEHLRRVADSVAIIAEAVSRVPFVVAWSTGKDSTAMCHLVRAIAPETPIIIQFDDCDWPSKRPYYERVCRAQGWACTEVEPDFSVWDRMRAGRIGEEDFCAQDHSLTRDAFLAPLDAARRRHRCPGVFLGLRTAESRARRVHLATRGRLYQITSGGWRCCPLAQWSAEDVFAYHVARGIEINPAYFNNRFRPPEEIRLSWAIPTPTSIRYGDAEHLRYYYPEQYRRTKEAVAWL